MDVIVVSRAPGVAGFSARVVARKLERESEKQVDAWKRLLSMRKQPTFKDASNSFSEK